MTTAPPGRLPDIFWCRLPLPQQAVPPGRRPERARSTGSWRSTTPTCPTSAPRPRSSSGTCVFFVRCVCTMRVCFRRIPVKECPLVIYALEEKGVCRQGEEVGKFLYLLCTHGYLRFPMSLVFHVLDHYFAFDEGRQSKALTARCSVCAARARVHTHPLSGYR